MPDPRTAVSGGVIFAQIFEEAGLPAGVLHVLPGGGDIGSALVTDANVQAVSFTGSTKAGQSVGELGGRHFTRVQLELGGNNALIVMDDADLDRTVAAAARGSFFNAGQGCMVIGRHLVHESIYDEYVGKLAATAGGLTVGNPPPTTSTWARSSTNASGTRSTRWSPAASRQAPRCAPAAPTTGSSTAPLSSPALVPARPHTTTRSSAPSPRSSLSPRPAKPSIWHQTVSTASTSAS
jgi:Aldehyde dehydrogenase family